MPISGKHRRPKSSTIARGVAAAGAGGAVIVLPLLGATGAHAAEQAAPVAHSAATHAASAAPVANKQAETRTYSVVAGDYLSKIATDNKVEGGWEKLYQDNREVIGGNPSLIHPGMKLTLGGSAAATGTTQAAPAPSKAPVATKPPAAQSSSSGYVSPVPGKHTTNYRASGANWSSGSHTGIDFPVATGTSVKAITSGTVVTAGWGGAYGNEVVVKHADGHYSQYGHLSALSVSVGQTVSTGQQIGLSGATGNVTGPHLHFEVRTGPAYGSDIDPVAFLASHGISV
ncbi:peptidoglycan DD-metalloendopeptidase family protein [Streptomyces sp. NBC_00121]|uniref:M23 family metallopeptidase n=1 Tax=unclassified Streptomyces TaxID=2593676 RepID=UPI0028C4894F|nr:MULTISPECIES: peptidoglycan DD-metalloendopeptidase family protein [unclassified Streptomyces]WNO68334.1 peptidoglycan DD-metalloendopeptidase family protein [Streptomyces sp. AM2-3-1]WSC72992.1 peptidoglycan DD-metalloendopeptidase family protein [Streptomyces sp. NBC_01760]WTE63433.1 peptidoglycan DD-metalloendopeptidase family protein [Streptomyces sp. NBC_01617]WTI90720.1 peptidoglycan DD-metalloendopeptidase family protein [Streptomyces sp. NBC_00724]